MCLALPGPLDFFRIARRLADAEKPVLNNLGIPKSPGMFASFYILARLFKWIYLVKRKGRSVGVLGAYSWEPGQSAFIAMVIWAKRDRGKGTGSRAVELASASLSKRRICTEFFAEVKEDNLLGINFWKSNGFVETGHNNQTIILSRQLPR